MPNLQLRSAQANISPERQRAAEFAAIVEASQDAILAKDLEGVITSWNGGAERLYGWSAEEAVGQHISLVIPSELEDEEASLLKRVAARRDRAGIRDAARRQGRLGPARIADALSDALRSGRRRRGRDRPRHR